MAERSTKKLGDHRAEQPGDCRTERMKQPRNDPHACRLTPALSGWRSQGTCLGFVDTQFGHLVRVS